MKTLFRSYRYLPWLVVCIAVILFSTAGIASIMGWRPTMIGGAGDRVDTLTSHDAAVSTEAVVLPAAPRRAAVRTNTRCAECGVIVSIGEINGHDGDFAIGATGGMTDKDPDRRKLNRMTRYEILVRMADGSSRVISQASPASWRPGERMMVIAGTIPLHK